MAPFTENVIVSVPEREPPGHSWYGALLPTAMIASRSEQVPFPDTSSSANVFTVMVAARAIGANSNPKSSATTSPPTRDRAHRFFERHL